MMNLNEFRRQYDALLREMEKRMNETENDRYIITDGVMHPDIYFQKDIRLAWMLKEPYDEEGGKGGGWSYFNMFPEDKDLYLEQFRKGHKTTWHPIIYISYGIHNDFRSWKDMDYIRIDHAMCDVVRYCAFINSQKLPSKGVTITNFNDLHASISKHSELLLKQIELLNPNVFIYGNTFHLYRPLLGLSKVELLNFKTCMYMVVNNQLHIDAYHPAQKTVKRENYVDDIISLVKLWATGELMKTTRSKGNTALS
jgi:hypothetical protein